YLIRYKTAGSRRKEDKETKRILIVGAGYAGATVIRDIQNGRYGNATAVAILDDDPTRQRSSLSRVPVVGGTDAVAETAEKYNISEIIIAIATPKGEITALLNDCIETGAHVMIYSGVREGAEVRKSTSRTCWAARSSTWT
ncbi:MAG: Gfo/Idh/MocA family oxidoreductase, partial [Clostridia bacterium]|nr:Gfo/Idh/MocA family oxidoreductase [Clostridia bacterium]